MDGDGCGEGQKQESEYQAVSHENGTVKQSYPYKADRDYLHSERNRLVDHEVCDVWTELRMCKQPFVTVSVSAQEESCCKKEKRRRWQYGQKGSKDTESKSYESQYCQKPFHNQAQKKGKLITSHRYDLLPLLRSSPGGIQRELVV